MNEKEFRAGEAKRLLNEPLLVEALDGIERAAVEDMIAADRTPEGDQHRRVLADRVQAIRDLRGFLETTIALGQQATRGPTKVA